jgi:hypothetical protein
MGRRGAIATLESMVTASPCGANLHGTATTSHPRPAHDCASLFEYSARGGFRHINISGICHFFLGVLGTGHTHTSLEVSHIGLSFTATWTHIIPFFDRHLAGVIHFTSMKDI